MTQRFFRAALTAATLAAAASCGLTPGDNPLFHSESQVITFSAPDELVPVELHYQSRTQLNALANAGVDFWSVDRHHLRAKAALNQAQYQKAKDLGVSIIKRKTAVLKNHFDKGYHTYDTMLAELKDVAAKHGDLCELLDIGKTWETLQSRADRRIWAIHFKKAGAGKPVVLFVGCHHAREIVTPEMVLGMVHYLADNYGKDAEVTSDIDNRDIWLVPMVNPDGHALAVQGESQRKNTNNITGGHVNRGVDLNRNYAAAWGTAGDSGDPDSDVFRGKSAFSEPETQAMRDLETRIKPVFLLTFHSFSNSVMWSWDKSDAPPPDPRLEPIGKQLGKLSGYDAYQGCQMYINSGDDVDWTQEFLHTLSYTVEIGSYEDNFDPAYSKVPQFWNENRPMMLYCLKVADNPNAVGGPELASAQVVNGAIAVTPKAPVTQAEYFLGRPGAAGTGHPLSGNGNRLSAPLSASQGREVVYLHARGANGVWGAWQTIWNQ